MLVLPHYYILVFKDPVRVCGRKKASDVHAIARSLSQALTAPVLIPII